MGRLSMPAAGPRSENATTAPTATAYANVALERTLKPAIWNTFSLPFSLSAEQIAASPLQGATIYAYESSDATSIRFTTSTEIEAGKPYLLKLEGNEEVSGLCFSGVAVTAPKGDVQGETGKVQFVAQTYNQPIEGDGACYLSTNGKVKRLAADGGIKGMRAYFLVPDATDTAGVKLFLSGTAVGLHEVTGADTHIAAHEIYDLVGRPVHKSALSRKGIYITNGRKITIKYNSRIKYH